ncbi:MAG: amidase family protein, partial [Bacteroidota bacterium]
MRSEELVQACLERIRATEPTVQAWTFLDEAHALAQSREADRIRREGRSVGPLHGVPVGIKDIVDTRDMPTENGSPLHAGRTPRRDATVVAMLRAAGAVIMGKTVT